LSSKQFMFHSDYFFEIISFNLSWNHTWLNNKWMDLFSSREYKKEIMIIINIRNQLVIFYSNKKLRPALIKLVQWYPNDIKKSVIKMDQLNLTIVGPLDLLMSKL
jgi:hypothetical protein